MLGMPAPTPYDLRFRLLGIPVRITPWFWLVTAVMGWDSNHPTATFLWIACVFVSILVHEFGHGLMAAFFGLRSEIALHGLGGVCASEGRQTIPQRLLISFAGPAAGFALFGIVYAVQWLGESRDWFSAPDARMVLFFLWWINLVWNMVNLLPIWPLDGGQMTSAILMAFNRRDGARRAHIVGLLTAGVLGVLSATLLQPLVERYQLDRLFLLIFFGFLAFANYQALQVYHQFHGQYGGTDDADWWKHR